ncbi:MAG: glycosyltransferase family 2 protein [Caldilinea sp.]|nr:glycosyltransferase family 2 protein [Caldilinea sp.]
MKHNSPLVSVVIPVFNGELYLASALDSVVAQDYRPLEIIIVDDGSTDATPSIVNSRSASSELTWQYHYQPNQGPGAARNTGLQFVTGEWIAFLDADDVWMPQKTSCQLNVFAMIESAGIVWGESRRFWGSTPQDAIEQGAIEPARPLYLLQSMLFRRSVLDLVGPFDPTLRLGEDVDWLLRALEQEVLTVIHPDPVVYYRRHATNLTHDDNASRRALHLILQRSLHRRRANRDDGQQRPVSLRILPRTGDA